MTTRDDPTPVNAVDLRIRAADWAAVNEHFFQPDGDEHGGAILCGATFDDGTLRLLVREFVPAEDGVDYLPGLRGYRHLDGAFVTRQLRRAKDLGLAYVAVHNHGGQGHVSFSAPDLASHERSYPTLRDVSGHPVGALVLARGAVAGEMWLNDGSRHVVRATSVVGDALERIDPGGSLGVDRQAGVAPQFERQALVFGHGGQRRLQALKVGVVGAGGVGMLIIQALSRLGVTNLVVIDPDVVSPSNLSRLPEARLRDAYGRLGSGGFGPLARRVGLSRPTSKVDLAGRIVKCANPRARITKLRADVAEDRVARELRNCDFLFLAADTMLARDVVNQIAYQYLVPTLQVGSKVVVNRHSGRVDDVYGVVRSIGSAPGCLRCNDLVSITKLAEEAVSDEVQRRNQRYVDEPGIDAPSVITLNAMCVGWAVNDFMHYASGLGRPHVGFRVLRSRPTAPAHPQLVVQTPDVDEDCHVCSLRNYSVLSKGDAAELPTRLR